MFGDNYPLYIFSRDSKTHFVVVWNLIIFVQIGFCTLFSMGVFFWILGLHSCRFVGELFFEMGSILKRVLNQI